MRRWYCYTKWESRLPPPLRAVGSTPCGSFFLPYPYASLIKSLRGSQSWRLPPVISTGEQPPDPRVASQRAADAADAKILGLEISPKRRRRPKFWDDGDGNPPEVSLSSQKMGRRGRKSSRSVVVVPKNGTTATLRRSLSVPYRTFGHTFGACGLFDTAALTVIVPRLICHFWRFSLFIIFRMDIFASV